MTVSFTLEKKFEQVKQVQIWFYKDGESTIYGSDTEIPINAIFH